MFDAKQTPAHRFAILIRPINGESPVKTFPTLALSAALYTLLSASAFSHTLPESRGNSVAGK